MENHKEMSSFYKIGVVLVFCFYTNVQIILGQERKDSHFVIAFGSCNKADQPQPFWKEIMKSQPDVFIWGGDNVYADTKDLNKVKREYDLQKSNEDYRKLVESIPVLGVWDDHDYGRNDVGEEWPVKKGSQELFLDFFDVSPEDERRKREGTYHAEIFKTPKGTIKIILLDTRYFRSPLVKSEQPDKRYMPTKDTTTTLLGKEQWKWLKEELKGKEVPDFTIIMSSIQFLSRQHGWETWGNFPHEIQRMENLLKASDHRVIFLSGDRHISEISSRELDKKDYPIIDFTSSGLTHSYTTYKGEPNDNRTTKVIAEPSYGLITLDLDHKIADFSIRKAADKTLVNYSQKY